MLLDSLGATKTEIVVSGDLNERVIQQLASEPVDGFGVGTQLVTGSGSATAGFVYKLVSIERAGRLIPVAKQSEDKTSDGGRKTAYRRLRDGQALEEFSVDPETRISPADGDELRQLQVPVITNGKVVLTDQLDRWRVLHQDSLAELGEFNLFASQPLFTCRYIGPGTIGRDR